jgi:hypothetical protein
MVLTGLGLRPCRSKVAAPGPTVDDRREAMESRTWKPSGALFAVLVAMTVVMGSAGARTLAADDDASRSDGEKSLQGVWRVTVTPYDCATGTPIVTFESMLTFARGGTLVGTTSAPLYLPGQRTIDQGFWRHKEGNRYRAVSEAYILFDSPAGAPVPLHRSSQRLTQNIRFDEDHPDTFTSRASIQYIGLGAGRPVLATGCANAVGQRFE